MEGATQLVSIVGQLVGDEYRQLRGVGGQVSELNDELETMNAILHMLSDADEGAVDHFIRVWMKQVRELACDAEDSVHLYIFRIRCRPGDRFLVWSRRLLATIFARRRLAGEIQALRGRAVTISERHARYGVSREALSRSAPPSLAAPAAVPGQTLGRPAANYSDHLVGVTEQANILAKMVTSNNEHDTKLKVFSVVGFGGLGKTTLAMEVCRQLEGDFQRQALVSVSQAFGGSKDLEHLLRRVLEQIVKLKVDNVKGIKEEDPLGGIHGMGVDDLAAKLKEVLKDLRYLIVVDDVWTVETWDAIKYKLPENNSRSRIIVTTRIETVAAACSEAGTADRDYIYQIKPLNLENSKKLFLARVFGFKNTSCLPELGASGSKNASCTQDLDASGSNNASCPPELEVEMLKILKKCGGLPMAIISIASILASYKSSESREMWERVCKSIGSQMETHPTLEGMRRIVTLSYSHLHHYLKGCMMYVSIFSEDFIIPKDRLLKRWIAEGLVAEMRGLTSMEVAEAYYNELVSRSMIDRAGETSTYYDGRVELCRVHDMVLEVMVSKSLEANFVSLVGGPYEGMKYDRIRRLSIHGGEEATEDSPSSTSAARHSRKNGIEGMNMQHVRSLSMFGLQDHTKVLDRLAEFTLLRVLDLEDCVGIKNKHLRYVCRMYLLRFLSLRGTNISKMPEEVGDLENLETLDVRETNIEDLPATMSKLEKLEHLYITRKGHGSGWIAPRGLGRMKALRTANRIAFGSDVGAAKELGKLQQLRELALAINITPDVGKELAASLSKINSLRWLNIGDFTIWEDNGLSFLHLVDPPPRLLTYLRIGTGIDKFPDWIRTLDNLVELFVAWTHFEDDNLFGPVCKLPNLKYMCLEAGFYKDRELVAEHAHSFPALKELFVNFDIVQKDLMKVLLFEENSMTKLEKLSVKSLNGASRTVVGIEHLKSLQEVELIDIDRKDNPALDHTMAQLKKANERRKKTNQIKVLVKYQ